jgi:hypothetical protein
VQQVTLYVLLVGIKIHPHLYVPPTIHRPGGNIQSRPFIPWRHKFPINPFVLECNPYQNSSCDTVPSLHQQYAKDEVCGLVFQKPPENAIVTFQKRNNTRHPCPLVNYTMHTFDFQIKAQSHDAVITHLEACGDCNTTQDLVA